MIRMGKIEKFLINMIVIIQCTSFLVLSRFFLFSEIQLKISITSFILDKEGHGYDKVWILVQFSSLFHSGRQEHESFYILVKSYCYL